MEKGKRKLEGQPGSVVGWKSSEGWRGPWHLCLFLGRGSSRGVEMEEAREEDEWSKALVEPGLKNMIVLWAECLCPLKFIHWD